MSANETTLHPSHGALAHTEEPAIKGHKTLLVSNHSNRKTNCLIYVHVCI